MGRTSENKTIKKVALYERYSSDKQQETSIEGQDKVCTQYCSHHGYTIVKRYVDRAVSAKKNLKKRVSFLEMMSDAEKGVFDAIVVYKMDRFSRDQLTTTLYMKKLSEMGIAIISASENLNTLANDGGMSMFMIDIVNAVSSYYSEELAQKVTRGMRVTAEKCQSNGGKPPLGYKVENKIFVIDQDEAKLVKEAFERVAGGESKASVARDFNRRGLFTGRGKPFSVSAFQRMIGNEKYIGVYRFGDIRIENGIPRIIDDGLFKKANEAISRREIMKEGSTTYEGESPYLLSGKLFCGECGARMVGYSATGASGKKYRYYACTRQLGKGHPCHKRKMAKEELESLVLEECRCVYEDKELKEAFVRTFAEEFNKIMRGALSEASLIECELDELKERKRKALDALIANPELASDIKGRVEEINHDIEEKEERLKEHKANLQRVEISEKSVEGFLDAVFSDGGCGDSKARVIDSMVSRVELRDNGEVTISLNIMGDEEIRHEKTLHNGSVRMIRLVNLVA